MDRGGGRQSHCHHTQSAVQQTDRRAFAIRGGYADSENDKHSNHTIRTCGYTVVHSPSNQINGPFEPHAYPYSVFLTRTSCEDRLDSILNEIFFTHSWL